MLRVSVRRPPSPPKKKEEEGKQRKSPPLCRRCGVRHCAIGADKERKPRENSDRQAEDWDARAQAWREDSGVVRRSRTVD